MNNYKSIIRNKEKFVSIVSFIFLLSFQIYNLDSDPSPVKRWGDIADEGYWVAYARDHVLQNNQYSDDMKLSLIHI